MRMFLLMPTPPVDQQTLHTGVLPDTQAAGAELRRQTWTRQELDREVKVPACPHMKTSLHTPEYLLTSADVYSVEAHQKGGAKAARDIDELVGEVTGLFAGGQLSEDALEGAMRALNDAYWMAKEKNKKFTPKKYRQQEE